LREKPRKAGDLYVGIGNAMLRELPNTKQVAGEPMRRWYFCHDIDLVVWFDESEMPIAFQLAYDKDDDERSISWHRDRGFKHYVVDNGSPLGTGFQTPFLYMDGPFQPNRERVLAEFVRLAGDLPPLVVAFVTEKLQAFNEPTTMKLDIDRIDAAILALLRLGLHDGSRAWKSFDWDAMARLHEKGLISDPVGKAKAVTLTDEGLRESERLLKALFGKPDA
jgi:hypothetical protein